MTLDDISQLVKSDGANIVQLLADDSCEMACVVFNKTTIYEGNFWDFYPGCYGGGEEFIRISEWRGSGAHSLLLAIAVFCDRMGFPIIFRSNGKYKYE